MSKLSSKLKRMLIHASQNSSFYAKRFKNRNINLKAIKISDDFSKIPPTTKKDLLNHALDMTAVSQTEISSLFSSGGTTGKPKLIYFTPEALKKEGEAVGNYLKVLGMKRGEGGVVMLPIGGLAIAGNSAQAGLQSIRAFAIPTGLTTQPFFTLQLIKMIKPTTIFATPSIISRFANEVKHFGTQPHALSVKRIIVGSEVLTSKARFQIEKTWNAKVYDWSGSTEIGTFGIECRYQNGQHLNVANNYFEVVDLETKKQIVRGSGIGELFVTTLINQATPLIRYRLNDIVKIDFSRCVCSSSTPRIWFMGRADDQIILPEGIKVYSYQIDEALNKFDAVSANYNAVFKTSGSGVQLHLFIETDTKSRNDKLKSTIANALINSSVDYAEGVQDGILAKPKVRFVEVGTLERTPRGKIKNKIINQIT